MTLRALIVLLCFGCCATTSSSQLLPDRIDPGPQVQPTSAAPEFVLIEGEIDDFMADRFIKDLAAMENAGATEVKIRINSGGGSIFAGFEMARAMESSKMKSTCTVNNLALSMALYLLQSCNVREMTKESLLMAHQGGGGVRGQVPDLERALELMKKLDKVMALHNSFRTTLTVDQYEERVSNGKEFWMTAPEALSMGFIDAIH